MSLGVRLALIALMLSALTVGYSILTAPLPEDEHATPPRWQSSHQCLECHEDVWGEWYGSHHQISYENEEVRKLSDDFRNKACQDCHLPQPVAHTGFGQRVLPRASRPDEGVGCITCHLGPDGEILAANDRPAAPCAPVKSEPLRSVDMCASCHNQHWTTDQWSASAWSEAGVGCNECHMPDVERRAANGAVRSGRGHGFAGGHDVAMLRDAVQFVAAVDAGQLVVTTTNTGAGHSFPTEERSRAADIRYRFLDADGAALAEDWIDARRFRMPYRNEELPDTQLPSGVTDVVRVDVPDGAAGAEIRLWYRTQPYVGDDHAASTLLFERSVSWTREQLARRDVDWDANRAREHGAILQANIRERQTRASERAVAAPRSTDVPSVARSAAFVALRSIADSESTPIDDDRMTELLDLLETAYVPGAALPRFRAMAQRSLAEHDDAVWVFERGLTHSEPLVRQQSAFELGRRGHRPAIPLLVLRLKNEEDLTALLWVTDALAKLGNHAGLDILEGLLGRAAIAEVTGARAIEILRAADVDPGAAPTWDQLRGQLSALHDAWRRDGIATGHEPADFEPLTRARVAVHLCDLEGWQLRPVDEGRFVLLRMGRSILPLLEQAVTADENYLRIHALEVVRDLGPIAGELAPTIVPHLDDPLSRSVAAQALGAIANPVAVPRLLELLDDEDVETRAAAAEALGPLGDPRAVAPLRIALARPDLPLDLRVRALFSLALLEPDGPELGILESMQERGEYHTPTLDELIDRVRAAR